MEAAAQRFACTQCGRCCNRSPEVELSEAAALADVFVFRLMFRLHARPRKLADYRELGSNSADSNAFYETSRLLSAFAARQCPARLRRNGRAVEYTKYLMISALALDANPGACSALNGTRCAIYERRPLACRSVPFHYSRAEALAVTDLNAFVETADYRCDTSGAAGVVVQSGRIVDPAIQQSRSDALSIANRDRRWSGAILQAIKASPSGDPPLPSMAEIESDARFGATTTSMRIAWRIACDAGLMDREEYRRLMAVQLATMERELAGDRLTEDARKTLLQMRSEYRFDLDRKQGN